VAPPILLLDDDLSLAQTMTMAIENLGIPVEQCSTGEVAIELIKKKQYSVVILDLILEAGVSGLYVVNAVRQLPQQQRPLVLMVTGANLDSLRGIDPSLVTAVMLKPVDFDLFAQYVLVTYRRSVNRPSEVGSLAPPPMLKIHTYCGECGSEMEPWIPERPIEAWMDTPCINCGTVPRHSGGHSDWTARV
jgi:DNA-binding response OmpR family regulator